MKAGLRSLNMPATSGRNPFDLAFHVFSGNSDTTSSQIVPGWSVVITSLAFESTSFGVSVVLKDFQSGVRPVIFLVAYTSPLALSTETVNTPGDFAGVADRALKESLSGSPFLAAMPQ